MVEWVGLGDNPKETTMELDNDSPIGGEERIELLRRTVQPLKSSSTSPPPGVPGVPGDPFFKEEEQQEEVIPFQRSIS